MLTKSCNDILTNLSVCNYLRTVRSLSPTKKRNGEHQTHPHLTDTHLVDTLPELYTTYSLWSWTAMVLNLT